MNKKIFVAIAILTAVINIGLDFNTSARSQTEVQFICADGFDKTSLKRYPTTYAWTPRGKTAVVRWKRDNELGFKDYPPRKRCQEVSPRFHKAYHQGNLHFLTNGILNNSPVICATEEYRGSCTQDNMLFTLKPEDDSLKAIIGLKKLFNGEIVGPINESSSTPQVYLKVDIESFLKNAPVE